MSPPRALHASAAGAGSGATRLARATTDGRVSLVRLRARGRDMEAADELKPFLLLAKTAKGAACAALIQQVLDHPNVYVFGELLDMPSVQEVHSRHQEEKRCAQ